jgi:hypothetical protein
MSVQAARIAVLDVDRTMTVDTSISHRFISPESCVAGAAIAPEVRML